MFLHQARDKASDGRMTWPVGRAKHWAEWLLGKRLLNKVAHWWQGSGAGAWAKLGRAGHVQGEQGKPGKFKKKGVSAGRWRRNGDVKEALMDQAEGVCEG